MRKTWSALRCSIGRMLSWKTIVFTVLSAALYVTLLPYVHQEGASIEEVLLTLVGGFEYEEIIAFKLDELFVWTRLLCRKNMMAVVKIRYIAFQAIEAGT